MFNHVLKFSKWFLIIPIVIFLLIVTITILLFSNLIKRSNAVTDKIQSNTNSMIESMFDSEIIKDQFSTDEDKEKEVTVNINEYGSTSQYKVKVTKYEVVEDKFKRIEEGYELVKFHLVV